MIFSIENAIQVVDMWLAAVHTYKPSTNNQYLYTYLPMLHVALLPTIVYFLPWPPTMHLLLST